MIGHTFNYVLFSTTQEAWEAMYQALLNARASIFWEVYILRDEDEMGKKFIDVLCDKTRVGVDVKIVLDTIGSRLLSRDAQTRLRDAGVAVVWYNRLYPEWSIRRWIRRVWIRNHRKVLIVDEQTAFVGGVNIDPASRTWDDLQLRIEGTNIRPLLRGFAKSFIHAGGSRKLVRHFLHPHLIRGLHELREHVKVLVHAPRVSIQRSSVHRFYIHQLNKARRHFTLLTPYFVPDRKFLHVLTRAKKRGVTVDIMLPVKPDHKFLEYMAQSFYDITKAAGARIFLLPQMNHGKALSIDGRLGFVGSTNFTPRSFTANEESGVYFKNRKMVNDLDKILAHWKAGAKPLHTHPTYRPWHQRLIGRIAAFFKDYV